MNIHEALQALGVANLAPAEQQQLDRDGYLPVRGVLTPDQVQAIRDRQAALLELEGAGAGQETYQEAGTACLADLINKGTVFHVVLTEPRVLAAVAHVLQGDLKLSSLNSRSALPGRGLQHLHPDWEERVAAGDYQVCNSVWLLDDFTPENGATRLVPGSHRCGKLPPDEMTDPAAPHPDEILLLGRAGDVVVFNGHAWHGGTLNRTANPRRALHGYFCRRHQPPQHDQASALRPETRQQLSEPARVVLGVE